MTGAIDFWTPKTSTKKTIKTNKQFEFNATSIKIQIGCSPWGHKESDMMEQLNNTFFADNDNLIQKLT